MKIKTKVMLSTLSMIVLPILLSIIFAVTIFQFVGSRYWTSLETMYQDDNGVYSA